MPSSRKKQIESSRSLKKPLGILVGLGLLVWLLFFDSHSLLSRVQWYNEYRTLADQNDYLHSEIKYLEGELEKGLSDETVEKIAREDYGMRRQNETVHPVVSDDD